MNFLFVGGSNTLIKNGYVEKFQTLYKEHTKKEISVTNIAIGANSSIHGIELLKKRQDLNQYDCIVVEYVVNDYAISTETTIHTWRQAYEGLLRFLIKNCNPQARIINLVLGRRDKHTLQRQRILTEEISGFVEKYKFHFQIEILDITKMLLQNFDVSKGLYASLYQDDAHYSTPFGSTLIGSLLLNHVLSEVENIKIGTPILPENKSTFEQSVVLDAADFSESIRVFENSRLHIKAMTINGQSSFELEIPGSLIAFSYISTFDCLSLVVSEEGEEPFLIDCRHSWPKSDHSRFMLKNFSLDWKSWEDEPKPRKLKFTAITEQNRKKTGVKKYIRQHNISAPEEPSIPDAMFYLSTLLIKK